MTTKTRLYRYTVSAWQQKAPQIRYTVGDFRASTKEGAIAAAKEKLRRQGNSDMCSPSWSFSASRCP